MRTRWSRTTAILGLLIAIFSDLRRRAWWLGRRSAFEAVPHPTTLVTTRSVEQLGHVPRVGWLWRPVVERALPVQSTATFPGPDGRPLPMVTIDVADRPEIADLPRVLATEVQAERQAVVGTNWLADPSLSQTVLVVTFVEPVTCTWAIGFDLPRCQALLNQVADGHELYVAWHSAPNAETMPADQPFDATTPPAHGLLLRVGRPDHLRAILDEWTTEHEAT